MSIKPPCLYHPSCSIICICTKPKCLMPLCRKCLPLHKHPNNRQSHIVPVEECLQTAKQSIMTVLDPLRSTLVQFSTVKRDRIDAFRKSLLKAKEELMENIEEQFDLYIEEALTEQNNSLDRSKLEVQQIILEMEGKLLHLQVPEISMKTFIEMYLNQDKTYNKLAQLSKIMTHYASVQIKVQPLNFSKWVKKVEYIPGKNVQADKLQKQSQAIEKSQLSSQVLPSDLNSDLEQSLENRINKLKSDNNEIMRILKNQ